MTIALVGLSWACGYMRMGLLVLFVHDFSDIFVDLLKMVNYLKLENRRGLFASEIAYIVCVLSWVYFRLYEFPFRVVRGSLTVPYTLLLRTPRESYSFLGLECVRPLCVRACARAKRSSPERALTAARPRLAVRTGSFRRTFLGTSTST